MNDIQSRIRPTDYFLYLFLLNFSLNALQIALLHDDIPVALLVRYEAEAIIPVFLE